MTGGKGKTVHHACGICGGSRFSPYAPKMYEFQGRTYDLVRCGDCGMVQVHPMLSEGDIRRLYDLPDYFEMDYDLGISNGSYFENRDSILSRQQYALKLFNRMHPKRGAFLEVGCAGGFFLEMMKAYGWDVTGVDISKAAAAYAGKRGLRVLNRGLKESRLKPASFDAVLLGDVLEHVRDPKAFLAEVRRILKPGGTLVVKCPSFVNSWIYRLIYLSAYLLKPLLPRMGLLAALKVPWHRKRLNRPYHLYEFDKPGMGRLMELSGFDLRRMDYHVIQMTFLDQTAPGDLFWALIRSIYAVVRPLAILFRLPLGSVVAVSTKPGKS